MLKMRSCILNFLAIYLPTPTHIGHFIWTIPFFLFLCYIIKGYILYMLINVHLLVYSYFCFWFRCLSLFSTNEFSYQLLVFYFNIYDEFNIILLFYIFFYFVFYFIYKYKIEKFFYSRIHMFDVHNIIVLLWHFSIYY